VDADRRQGLADLIELEGFDDRDNEFHDEACSPGMRPPCVPGAASIWHLSGQMAQKICRLKRKNVWPRAVM
jgi:hypothetical protein